MSNRRRIIGFSLILLILETAAYSTTYYVDYKLPSDSTNTYSIADRSSSGTDGTAFNTLYKANHAVKAGDIVYIRGGTAKFDTIYVGTLDSKNEGIHPSAIGTSASNRITYATYKNEKVNFVGIDTIRSSAAFIVDKDWIKITGYDGSTSAMNLKFSNMAQFLWIWSASPSGGHGSHYNEVSYCEFAYNNTWAIEGTVFRGSTIYRNSQYNWIHHCSFHDFGYYTWETDGAATFELGNEEVGNGDDSLTDYWTTFDNTGFNVVENCKFYHAGHHTFGLESKWNIIRNNIFHNEQFWYAADSNKYYGYRNIYACGDWAKNHGFNVFEGNTVSHAAGNMNPGNNGGQGMSLDQSNDIVRYNDYYANGGKAFHINDKWVSGADHEQANYTHIYNNTIMSNGFIANYDLPQPKSTGDRMPIVITGQSTAEFDHSFKGIVIVNNIFWKNYSGQGGGRQIGSYMPNGTFNECSPNPCGGIIIAPNWVDTQGDPKFTSEGSYGNPSIGTTKDWYWGSNNPGAGADITTLTTQPDFSLQSSSPVIDQGTYLTQAKGVGSNSTALVVNDPKYFQPGWGNGAGGGASVQADWIAIDTVSNTVQISSIDYAANTITLASPKSWSDKDPVWLYKKSDGVVVLSGTAPDYGAHEFGTASSTTSKVVLPEKTSMVWGPLRIYSLKGQVVGEITGIHPSGTARPALPPGVYFLPTAKGGKCRYVKYAVVK